MAKKTYAGKVHLKDVPCGVDWKSRYQLETDKSGSIPPKITCKTCIRIWNESQK